MYTIVDIICSDIHPVQNLRVLKSVDNREKWAYDVICRGFKLIEKLLTDGSDYCLESGLSYADCCLIPQVYNAQR